MLQHRQEFIGYEKLHFLINKYLFLFEHHTSQAFFDYQTANIKFTPTQETEAVNLTQKLLNLPNSSWKCINSS